MREEVILILTEEEEKMLKRHDWNDANLTSSNADVILWQNISLGEENRSVQWPNDFNLCTGIRVPDEKIQAWIEELIKSTEEDFGYIASGDTIVIKLNGEIIVAKNYYRAILDEEMEKEFRFSVK